MPHKHTRKGDLDRTTINLPPTTLAKPLPVSKSAKANGVFTNEINAKRNNKKRKRNADKDDDTPKAFLRLMAFKEGRKLPKALDDGVRETKAAKKRKLMKEQEGAAGGDLEVEEIQTEVPKIKPGERMSEFAARVDAALPVSGLINNTAKGGKDPLGLKIVRTKKEKKMHKMYDEWREQDRKIKEKRQDALELAEEEEMDQEGGVKWKIDMEDMASRSNKKGKGTRKMLLGEVNDGEDDPWAEIKRKRGEEKVGLNDVVQAPPVFLKAPKEKFKVRRARVEVEGVPKSSGSLRRREELGEVRRSVVEGYRQMMKENRTKSD